MPEEAEILHDSRWQGPHGIGRWATQVRRRIPFLAPLQGALDLFHPLDPFWLAHKIRKLKPAAYFSPGFNAPLATPDVPLIFTVHDLNYVHFESNTTALKRAYFALLVKPACRRAHRVLTVSEFSRRQIIEWAGVDAASVVNVSAGVDGAFNPAGECFSPGYPYILFAGGQSPHKNLRRTVQALARSQLARDVRLLVTGTPTPATRHWLEAERLHPFVAFAGVVADDRLPDYYRGALAVAMPSLFEGFGLPVIEAMACGIPVVTSTATSLPEVAGDAAVLVDPIDTEAIAAALGRIVSDSSLRMALRVAGIARAGLFTWDRTADQIAKILCAAAAQ